MRTQGPGASRARGSLLRCPPGHALGRWPSQHPNAETHIHAHTCEQMHVCTHTCAYNHMHAHTRAHNAHTHAQRNARAIMHTQARTHTCTHISMRARAHTCSAHSNMCKHGCTHKHASHACTHVYMHPCACMCALICTHMDTRAHTSHTCMYVHTHERTCAHTPTHALTDTHTHSGRSGDRAEASTGPRALSCSGTCQPPAPPHPQPGCRLWAASSSARAASQGQLTSSARTQESLRLQKVPEDSAAPRPSLANGRRRCQWNEGLGPEEAGDAPAATQRWLSPPAPHPTESLHPRRRASAPRPAPTEAGLGGRSQALAVGDQITK